MSVDKNSLGFLVADVSRLLRVAFQKRLGAGGLTFLQARTLAYVSRHEGVRQNQLADLLETQPITLVHIIDQLEARRLVKRVTDTSDRRAKLIYLAPASTPVLEAIEAVASSIRDDAMLGLNDDEANFAVTALDRMRANLNPESRV